MSKLIVFTWAFDDSCGGWNDVVHEGKDVAEFRDLQHVAEYFQGFTVETIPDMIQVVDYEQGTVLLEMPTDDFLNPAGMEVFP